MTAADLVITAARALVAADRRLEDARGHNQGAITRAQHRAEVERDAALDRLTAAVDALDKETP